MTEVRRDLARPAGRKAGQPKESLNHSPPQRREERRVLVLKAFLCGLTVSVVLNPRFPNARQGFPASLAARNSHEWKPAQFRSEAVPAAKRNSGWNC
jgi:hypothetical protein